MLIKLGFMLNITNLFSSYFEDRVTNYLWGQQVSPLFLKSDGVPQGDPLSPILSNLYVAIPLCVHFPFSLKNTENTLSFIDDYVLSTISNSLRLNIDRLSLLYRLFYDIIQGCGLTIEPEKTELFNFAACDLSKNTKPIYKNITFSSISLPKKEHNLWTLTDALQIQPKSIWRYLGFFFDSELNFDAHVQKYINKSMSALNAMRMLGNSIEGFTPSKRKLVYTACIWSIASYGSQLWYRKNAKGIKQKTGKLDKVKNTAMRWISRAFLTTPITALEVITAIPPIITQLNIMTTKYALRINKLSPCHPCRRIARTL
ncbi:hypothetical protein AX15_006717 [Amanita polypyramis BW_CC]|nr:hypothetical protein AX15_006717 [Amanita polypyramis BW_CC]